METSGIEAFIVFLSNFFISLLRANAPSLRYSVLMSSYVIVIESGYELQPRFYVFHPNINSRVPLFQLMCVPRATVAIVEKI